MKEESPDKLKDARVPVTLTHSEFLKLRKINSEGRLSIDTQLGLVNLRFMVQEHSVTKASLSALIERDLYMKVKKKAKEMGMTVTSLITAILIKETENIELTIEDYEEIIQDIKAAGRNRVAKRNKKKALEDGEKEQGLDG